jgi:outer membrane biosynthesis protein TonB
MSGSNKYRKNIFPEFIRYMQGRMSGKEKNSFERELQKDPFSEEASEGFEILSPETAPKDIAMLQKRLKRRISGRKAINYYRIAASVAVLMIISTVFIVIDRNQSGKQLAKNVLQPENPQIAGKEPLKEQLENPQITEKEPLKEQPETVKKSENNAAYLQKSAALPHKKINSENEGAVKAEDEAVVARAGGNEDTGVKKIMSAGENADSEDIPAPMASAKSKNEAINVNYEAPVPASGKAEFNRYIQENIRKPGNTEAGKKVVVVISFLVHSNGTIDSIQIVRSPGKLFSDEAIRLLKEGPDWRPAMENGEAIKDEVRLRIVFE